MNEPSFGGFIAAIVVGVLALILLLVVVFGSHTTIEAGHVGVYTKNGAVTGEEFGPGFHWMMPIIGSVADFDTHTQKYVASKVSAATSDLQTVTTDIAVNFHPDPVKITELYQSVGTDYVNTVLEPAILESLKTVTAKYTASQLIDNRAEVKAAYDSLLSQRVAVYHIKVDAVSITQFQYSDAFNNAIEAKQVAAQAVLTAQQQLDRAKIDAQQQVVSANAAAQAQIVTARANAQSQSLQVKTLNALYLQYQALLKWDGHLPQYNAGTLPFITIK